MALTKRYIVHVDDEPNPGRIEVQDHHPEGVSDTGQARLELYAATDTPPAAPDEVKLWLSLDEALELAAAIRTAVGAADLHDLQRLAD